MQFSIARRRMVDRQLRQRGITDPRVIQVMLEMPRHLFVEPALQSQAYSDYPLPIGQKQTISQPFMVATMSQALELKGDEQVLEIGTGSGYQAAVLAKLCRRVFTVERIPELARQARRVFDDLHLHNINLKVTDGTFGWEEQAPFDGIVVTAGAPDVPRTYLDQLADGGRLIIPVGDLETQSLKRITRRGSQFETESLLDCRFVPLLGEKGWHLPE
ncbi:protein-L-isoaspartate O-methyltransferase [Geothermobacter hydrogeniphilus]|uniref:Protein-L-isoaspartate O-methyltransferase n=1 Tax=Geothermobacter hydrogeniphilus TaxID=1969733 RepID=A0A2K2H8E3_9BACT|nr:protein-L-isoaspartate(D-aspartate) O-methyltransferase [Geothermobacter hydrogeniphilus]PNU19531.1 protein-L-isoaspartate O-methyltransferase [Geothermobacter hydrogeniphilus]